MTSHPDGHGGGDGESTRRADQYHSDAVAFGQHGVMRRLLFMLMPVPANTDTNLYTILLAMETE